jgi:ABC-type Mn2+/Zn2+ transport system ATPase subunit
LDLSWTYLGLAQASLVDGLANGDAEETARQLAERSVRGYRKLPLVLARHLRHQYPNTADVAVKDVSFGVPAGQVFGLLGTNGAGKSTTFGMLSGELAPSGGGDAFITGHSVTTDLQTARRHVGYCPQFDATQVGIYFVARCQQRGTQHPNSKSDQREQKTHQLKR